MKLWAWAFAIGGVLFLIGGLTHPMSGSDLPEPQATAEFIGAPAWPAAHSFILAGTIGFLVGLFALARSDVPLSTGARRAAWVAAIAAVLLAIEGFFHLAAFTDRAALLAGAATPFLTTHMMMSLVVYPLFTFAVAVLAVLSGRLLTHPVVGAIGAIGAVGFGLGPALVGLAGIEVLAPFLFGIAGIVMALWFVVVGVTGVVRGRTHSGAAAAAS
jgi:hypothetical protein